MELCFEFSRTPHGHKEWFIKCRFLAWFSASRYRCGSTCWNGVTRSCAGSSIISIGTIPTSLSWCSSQTQVGHGSLGAHLMPPERISLTASWDDCQPWCVFCETAEQTVWCINKESCICCGEIYKCCISLVGDLIIQARLARGEDEAFRISLLLPLRKWIRLDCYIQDSEVQDSACSSGCQNWGGEGPQATDFSLFCLMSLLHCPRSARSELLLEQL